MLRIYKARCVCSTYGCSASRKRRRESTKTVTQRTPLQHISAYTLHTLYTVVPLKRRLSTTPTVSSGFAFGSFDVNDSLLKRSEFADLHTTIHSLLPLPVLCCIALLFCCCHTTQCTAHTVYTVYTVHFNIAIVAVRPNKRLIAMNANNTQLHCKTNAILYLRYLRIYVQIYSRGNKLNVNYR